MDARGEAKGPEKKLIIKGERNGEFCLLWGHPLRDHWGWRGLGGGRPSRRKFVWGCRVFFGLGGERLGPWWGGRSGIQEESVFL